MCVGGGGGLVLQGEGDMTDVEDARISGGGKALM